MNVKECTKCKRGFYRSGFSFCPICGTLLLDGDENLSNLIERMGRI